MKETLVLGIESSCDETSVAVVKNGREVLSNVIDTQIKIHEQFGGVVPEIASRNHIEAISRVTKLALEQANVKLEDIDVIAPTYGPGLVGALLVGVSYGRGLAYALNKPLVGVNHLEGHISANYITHPDLEPPFLCMLTSGGNTQIVYVKDYCDMEVLGRTRDDAIGEAFDKVARVIGLTYPGGPKIDKLAEQGKATINFPKTHFENLDFSFSGIKTAVINLHHKNPEVNKSDLCMSFEKAVTEVLTENIEKAIKQTGIKKVVLAGGVSANTHIREEFEKLGQKLNVQIYKPDLKLCTDNAAMIGSAGYYRYLHGDISDNTLNAVPNLKIGE
ncbi:MAG: tRNA (adenosine(37)-N6)-threonylcarbamoyltransferase complex transferase subunit TsaD [Clostridium sp. 26_21]|nr:tRNA (adenosine(37)-N6)-threonylcarbamoyltransferase complex transferase subunit TsaD [Clostridia bacterium]OKZ56761.1 MAG: tRNA (adenosine(37)-N6)-threonylcarbamoyltransferase complex transferase subunit TsaD [Clostridium sp. 26_21]